MNLTNRSSDFEPIEGWDQIEDAPGIFGQKRFTNMSDFNVTNGTNGSNGTRLDEGSHSKKKNGSDNGANTEELTGEEKKELPGEEKKEKPDYLQWLEEQAGKTTLPPTVDLPPPTLETTNSGSGATHTSKAPTPAAPTLAATGTSAQVV